MRSVECARAFLCGVVRSLSRPRALAAVTARKKETRRPKNLTVRLSSFFVFSFQLTRANRTGASAEIMRTSSSDFMICVRVKNRERGVRERVLPGHERRSRPPSLPFFFPSRTFLMRASGSWWFLNSAGSVPTAWTSRICWAQKARRDSDWAWAWAAVCWA